MTYCALKIVINLLPKINLLTNKTTFGSNTNLPLSFTINGYILSFIKRAISIINYTMQKIFLISHKALEVFL